MDTLVALPVTSYRSVDDWPRSMDVGSAENEATTGAPGSVVSGVGVVVPPLDGGGGAGGDNGAFFLQPAEKRVKVAAKSAAVILRFPNMNVPPSERDAG